MKKRTEKRILMALLVCIGMFSAGCKNEDAKNAESVESTEETGVVLADSYKSKVISLGEYKNLSYSYDGNREPAEEEVEAEMEAILCWFEGGELTEEFVQQQLGFDSIEAFREETRSNLKKVYEQRANTEAGMELMNQIIEASELQIEEEDVERQYKQYMDMYRAQAKAEDMELDEFAESWLGVTLEELEESSRASAERIVCIGIITQAIAEAENLDAEASFEEVANELAARNGFDSIEELEADLGGRDALLDEIRYELVIRFLMANGNRN